MDATIKINDCVGFKNELHNRLYIKSGARNFDEYIKYVNSVYSNNKESFEKTNTKQRSPNQ